MDKPDQILKSRDDKLPVTFSKVAGAKSESFKRAKDTDCSWAKEEEEFGASTLRPRIEPWLTALFQSEHFAVLVGSGLTHAVHHMATGSALPGMDAVRFSESDKEINAEAVRSAELVG